MISPELLRRFACFSPVEERTLKALAMIAREEHVPAGRVLFNDGDPADGPRVAACRRWTG